MPLWDSQQQRGAEALTHGCADLQGPVRNQQSLVQVTCDAGTVGLVICSCFWIGRTGCLAVGNFMMMMVMMMMMNRIQVPSVVISVQEVGYRLSGS